MQEVFIMPADLIVRLIGMVVFGLFGARLGVDLAPAMTLPPTVSIQICALTGVLIGLILTPYLTTRPVRGIRNFINNMPIDSMFTALAGLAIGLFVGLLAAYPLSLIPGAPGDWLPATVIIVGGYLGGIIFMRRYRDIWNLLAERFGKDRRPIFGTGERQVLLDTSVLIDGRIVDIAKTGFIGGTLSVPRFVLNELHQVADSSDTLRRNRGRHGLTKLNELQREANIPFKIIEDDVPGISEVDDKLVALARKLNSPIITNDYPLNRIAETQGVQVLNVNALSNAVRSMYLPGDVFPIRIIQEGKEIDQGVGYLEDGTMVVVEGGKQYMDRTINVYVTRFINREAGRMFFAVPDSKK